MPDVLTDVLTDDELTARLGDLDGWEVVDGRLQRELRFADFSEAFAFMTRVAMIAEKLNHHPDWSNSWNRVVIDIVSHDAGGITGGCVELASRIDRLVA
ncbi:MAG: 4a-hydroxytetrahydrobiopterin dehydratase [Acidimicrobiales bacterium]